MYMSMIRDYKMINNAIYQHETKVKEVADKMKLGCKTWLSKELKLASK